MEIEVFYRICSYLMTHGNENMEKWQYWFWNIIAVYLWRNVNQGLFLWNRFIKFNQFVLRKLNIRTEFQSFFFAQSTKQNFDQIVKLRSNKVFQIRKAKLSKISKNFIKFHVSQLHENGPCCKHQHDYRYN